jgi:Zn-dependent oligopeptidase
MENWANEKESLEKLAKHFETLKKIPKNMLERFDKLKTYMI